MDVSIYFLVILSIFSQPNNRCSVMASTRARLSEVQAAVSPQQASYVAAIYEHRPQVLRPLSRKTLNESLDTYERVVSDAVKKGANIVVFPEDGLMGFGTPRDTIYPYLELLPPKGIQTNPCDEEPVAKRHQIQHRLSCLAKTYGVYLVVNIGTVIFCNASDPCPPDGRFQYNTNVVFDAEGNFVSSYNKWNLFGESMYDFPAGPEYATFDTPFGKFASIVCFDILFKEPAVDLVEKHGVTNIIMPTAWRSILPAMQGIGFHGSWALRMGVNLLTAELHFPELDFAGSGIFSGAAGALAYINRYEILSPPELLVSNISSTPSKCKMTSLPVPPSRDYLDQNKSRRFQAELQGDLFTFITLDQNREKLKLNTENMNCYLDYQFDEKSPDELYAFGIFEGLHLSYLNSSIQVCALVRCAGTRQETCGTPTREATSRFSYVKLQGKFSTDYIFPSVLTKYGNLATNWNFSLDEANNGGMIEANSTSEMLSAILYARMFKKDNNVRTPYYHIAGQNLSNDTVHDTKTDLLHSLVHNEVRSDVQHPIRGNSSSGWLVPMFTVATLFVGIVVVVALIYDRTASPKRQRDYEEI